VVDQGVATTTGVTASMPISLTLIEASAGREKAEAVGQDIGLRDWDGRHASDAFQFTRPFALTAMGNTLAFWKREQLGIELTPGVDEVSLALVADAWSRTYRSRAVTFSRTEGAQQTRNGIRMLPDQVAASWPSEHLLPAIGDRQPATGNSVGRSSSWDQHPLRRAHGRLRRHAARIPEANRIATMSDPSSEFGRIPPGNLVELFPGELFRRHAGRTARVTEKTIEASRRHTPEQEQFMVWIREAVPGVPGDENRCALIKGATFIVQDEDPAAFQDEEDFVHL
jgi:hypothetical protein